MGEMINGEERSGGREPWVGMGGPQMGGCEGTLGYGPARGEGSLAQLSGAFLLRLFLQQSWA